MNLPKTLDLHMHSTVSDGTDSPPEILARVKDCGLQLFSLTDHDAVRGCRAVREELEKEKGADECPGFINGAEFSCKDDLGKYHILGYRYDSQAESINALTEKAHSFRMRKTKGRLDFLRDAFDFVFSDQDIQELLALDNPGKPHIGNLMVKYGYAPTKEEAISNYINRMHFRNIYLKPQEAIEGILRAGGIPVLAHPSYGDGDQIIVGEELKDRIERLIGFGLQGVEAFYSGFTPKLIGELLGLAKACNLYITAGSDYHGTNKLVALGSTQLPEQEEWPEGLTRFLADAMDQD